MLGVADFKKSGDVFDRMWDKLNSNAHALYSDPNRPGTPLTSEQTAQAEAKENFLPCEVKISSLDILKLEKKRHLRAKVEFRENQDFKWTWLNP